MYLVVGMLWLWIRIRGHTGRRNPLTQDLLRSPGESVREQSLDVYGDLLGYMTFSSLPAVLAYLMYVSHVAYEGKAPGFGSFVLWGILLATFYPWLLWKIWKILKKKQLLTLGFEAELAVGQELNALARQGYYVFHDLPANNFNIDHIVVGTNGVFAVETKGRAKPTSAKTGTESWKVYYDGKCLQFPGWRETKPLEQAERQAKWLSKWLGSAVGDAVPVQAVLVLPGWFVERTSGKGIAVLSGKQLEKSIPRLGNGERLDAQMIQRVAHQLDQRCRNVARRAYATEPQS